MNATERQKAIRHILDRSRDIFRVAKRNQKEKKDVAIRAIESKQMGTAERIKLIASGQATLNPDRLYSRHGGIATVDEAFDCPGDTECRAAIEACEEEYTARIEALEKDYFEIRDRANLQSEPDEFQKIVALFDEFKKAYYIPASERSDTSFGGNYSE